MNLQFELKYKNIKKCNQKWPFKIDDVVMRKRILSPPRDVRRGQLDPIITRTTPSSEFGTAVSRIESAIHEMHHALQNLKKFVAL